MDKTEPIQSPTPSGKTLSNQEVVFPEEELHAPQLADRYMVFRVAEARSPGEQYTRSKLADERGAGHPRGGELDEVINLGRRERG